MLLQAQALLRKLERGEAGDDAAADVVSYTILISALARRGQLTEANYTERLNVGYRWYDRHGVTPNFAFVRW